MSALQAFSLVLAVAVGSVAGVTVARSLERALVPLHSWDINVGADR